ncbi:MAG: hypothetical protein QME75_05660 [Deltaproteobacteria bacterium]|nr:hypothetical protein [Deltaproteobacteria bacterium]
MEALENLQAAQKLVKEAYNELLGRNSPGVTMKLAEVMIILQAALEDLEKDRVCAPVINLEVPSFLRRR